MNPLLSSALAYTRAGLSVIPCDRRRKQPRLQRWKPYQDRPPTPFEVWRWFGPWTQADALAVITGGVSGDLEVIDFDAPALFAQWATALTQYDTTLLARLPVVQTQRGGYHVYYRCDAAISGNQKLAVDPAKPGGKFTLIETRGAGGYVLAPPSAGYTVLQGDLTAIPFLSCEERAALLDTARQFSRVPLTCAPRTAMTPWRYAPHAHRPGDDYNRRGDVAGVLERHGWRCVRHVHEATYWRRPGKRLGHSATYNYRDSRCFYVFTSNAPPFDPARAYSPFAVFALLEHGGDYHAAASALRRLGYGNSG